MASIATALRLTGGEFWFLLRRTATTLFGIWPQAIGLLLLGWSAKNLAILLATELSVDHAWAVIPVIALGAVLQLVTILALLRFAAQRLGVGRAPVPDAPTVDASLATSGFANLVSMTLLTFMALYAAFGYLSDYARQVVLLSTYRKGFGDLLNALNPMQSTTVAVAMVAIVAGGWIAGRLIEPWSERSRYPVLVRFLGIAIEAVVALTGLLGLFRLVEAAGLWLSDRVFTAWLDAGRVWARGLIHVDLPALLVQAWTGFVDVVWPVLSTGILRPLVWLAIAGLVFGARVLSLAELWRLDRHPGEPSRRGLVGRLRTDTETTAGVRAVVLRTQEFLFGGLDERVLPAWQSFRLVLRAGWPFLGGYVIVFTLVDLAGQYLENLIVRLIGGQPIALWIKLDPFVDLAVQLLVTGFQWVLLVVAYHRALGESLAEPQQADRRPGEVVRAVTVGILTLAVVVAAGLAKPGDVEDVTRYPLNQKITLSRQVAVVGDPRLSRAITTSSGEITTDRIFLVVPFGVGSPVTPLAMGVNVTLRVGGRTYAPFNASSLVPAAPPGFSTVEELVFEVDPADAGPGAVLRLRPSELVSATQQQAEVDLGLGADAVASALPTTEVVYTPERHVL